MQRISTVTDVKYSASRLRQWFCFVSVYALFARCAPGESIEGCRAGFRGERPELSPRGLYKTVIESTYFIETFPSQKSREVSFLFSYFKK
jgi:hypothetical protein